MSAKLIYNKQLRRYRQKPGAGEADQRYVRKREQLFCIKKQSKFTHQGNRIKIMSIPWLQKRLF